MHYKATLLSLFSLCFSLSAAEDVYLATPRLTREEMIGTSVGIRPCRKSGVRLEAECVQDKLIVHNYGYGGSGLTLCFGGSQEVLEILKNQGSASKTVAVLGAGVVGLATAYDLLEKGYEVHLYSDKWSPDLTSNVAPGAWTSLSLPNISEEKSALHERMLKNAKQRFLKSTGDNPEFSGIKMMNYYVICATQEESLKLADAEEVVIHFDNGAIKNGRRRYKLGMDGDLFVKDLYSKVVSKGATLQQRRFNNLEEIMSLKEPIIINCMSMGARAIFKDQDFIPVRGQLIHFKRQDKIDYVLAQDIEADHFLHIHPWSDRIILGGVYERGQEEPIVDPETINAMLQKAEKCLAKD